MLYTENFLEDLAKFREKPAWILIKNNDVEAILQKMIDKFSAPFTNTDKILIINFTKKNFNYNYIKINGNLINIAICEDENEKNRVSIIWNTDNEMFDHVFTEKEFNNWIKQNNMKFDKVIMNPPYNGNSNLYGRITAVAKQHSKEVVCLSPYLNYLSTVQKKSIKNTAKGLLPYLNDYEVIETNSNLFNAAFDKDLCIFHFMDNPTSIADIDEIYWNQFSNPDLTKSIICKMQTYHSFCYDKIIPKKDFDDFQFKVAFTGVRGHCTKGKKQWDWTTILDEDKMINFNYSSTKKEDLYGIPLKNENECKEFVKWANSDVFGYLILVQKHSINMDKWLFKIIPFFDFSKTWTEEDYCKELKLTDEEYQYIVNEMKDFGWKVKKNEVLEK